MDITKMDLEKYVLVKWPDSQELMDEKWFHDEAILAVPSFEQGIQTAAYFVPYHRLIEFSDLGG